MCLAQRHNTVTPVGTRTSRFKVRRSTTVRGSEVAEWLALASCARGPGFDPRHRRGKFVGPNMLPFVSFAGMT